MMKKLHYILALLTILAINDPISAATGSPPQSTPDPSQIIGGNNGTNDENKLYVSTQITVSNLYPNPADNYVEIDYHIQDHTATDAKLTIRNVLGVLVGEYGLGNNGGKLHIDTSRLSAGVYFYTLSLHNKNVATKKLLIRN
jgi:hypothetical protein